MKNQIQLTDRIGIKPAAYVGRYGWVHVGEDATIGDDELKDLIKRSYQLVFDKLPSKLKKSVATNR